MPTFQVDLIAPLLLDDRLRSAEMRRLHQALSAGPGLLDRLETRLADLFCSLANHFEIATHRRRVARTHPLTADLCPRCGN